MSKRQAGVQLTKDREEEEEWGRDGPPDPVVQASAEVLAKRKIAKPKSQRRPIADETAETTKTPSPFSFGASAFGSGNAAPAAKVNPFSTLGSSDTNMSADKAAAVNPFGAITRSSNSSAPSFSFGGSAAGTTNPSNAPATTNPTNNVMIEAKSVDEDEDLSADDAEFQRLLRARSVNIGFEAAIKSCLENDPFTDLTTICEEYQTHRKSMNKVPIESAKGTNGTGIYPSFSQSAQTATVEEPETISHASPPKSPEKTPAPAPSFNFNPTAPSFSFVDAKDTASGSSFTFGQSSVKPPQVEPTDKTPTFSFGQSTKTPDKTPDEADPKEKKEDSAIQPPKDTIKNDFSWTPDRGIKFGDSSKSATKTDAPVFNFNNPLASPSGAPSSTSNIAKPAGTAFAFGSTGNTGFSFGQQTSSSTAADTKSTTDSAPVPAKPTFNFGSAAPTFSFGQSSTPTFSFTAPPKKDDSKPSDPSTLTPNADTGASATEEEEDAMPTEERTNDALIAGAGVGEEDEEEVYSIPKTKLHKFNPDSKESPWTDIGICMVKVLVHKTTRKSRIIARSEGAGALRLNARMYPHFKYTLEGKAQVKVSDLVSVNQTDTWLVKCRDREIATQLVETLNQYKL